MKCSIQGILVLCCFLAKISSVSAEILWSNFIASDNHVQVITAVDDGGLFIKHPDRNAFVFFTESGEVAWEVDANLFNGNFITAAAYQNSKIFCTTRWIGSVEVYNLNGGFEGRPPLSSEGGGYYFTPPALAGNGIVAVGGATHGRLVVFNMNAPEEGWFFQGETDLEGDFDWGVTGQVSVSGSGNFIFRGHIGNLLYSINPDGTLYWQTELPSYVEHTDIVIDNLNNILLPLPGRRSVVCVSSDGVIKWELQSLYMHMSWLSNIVVDEANNYYLMAETQQNSPGWRTLFKISPQGEIVWEKSFPHVVSNLFVTSDHQILVYNAWRQILKIDCMTGTVTKTISLVVSSFLSGHAAVLSNSGILYVSSFSSTLGGNTIYAINTGSESAAYSSWSQYRGNAGRTGGVLSQDGILPDRWKEGIVRRLGATVTAEDLMPDGDADKDGLSNIEELRHGVLAWNPDTDGDGMPDGWEVEHGLNPADPSDAFLDSNYDGVLNRVKYQFGLNPNLIDSNGDGKTDAWFVNQNKHLLDTDGDGLPDMWEIEHGLNPNDPADALIDSNDNGVVNLAEFAAGTNPHEVFLAAGWNLVSVVRAMKRGNIPEWDNTIWRWDGVASIYVQVGSDDYLLPVYGYWVYVLEDTFFDSTNP